MRLLPMILGFHWWTFREADGMLGTELKGFVIFVGNCNM